jgi:hypothetical protein
MDNQSMIDANITNVSGTTPTILDGIKSVSIGTWVIIILIFAFLGFNVFVYLAEGTQDITNIFKPLFGKLLGILGLTFKEVVDITAEGSRAIVNTTAKVIDVGTTKIQNAVDKPFEEAEAKKKGQTQQPSTQQSSTAPSSASSSVKGQQVQQPQMDVMQNNTLNKALNTSAASNSSSGGQGYEADDSSSSIQQGGSKSGWCYIGEDRGFRTCAQVGVNDTCMSGEIFPSQDICINPNLRP